MNARISFIYSLLQVHWAVRFDQKPWVKRYVHFNATRRANASNEFEKNFFKFIDHPEFGKML